MTRGNQRELARERAKKRENSKKSTADQKDGNKGVSLEERKRRDAEAMRLKQKKAEEKAAAEKK